MNVMIKTGTKLMGSFTRTLHSFRIFNNCYCWPFQLTIINHLHSVRMSDFYRFSGLIIYIMPIFYLTEGAPFILFLGPRLKFVDIQLRCHSGSA